MNHEKLLKLSAAAPIMNHMNHEKLLKLSAAAPVLLEACRQAAIICDQFADWAKDSPDYAIELNRLSEILENAISKAT